MLEGGGGGVQTSMAGVQCNLLFLEAEWTNPKCQMSYSIILTEINFYPESLNLIVRGVCYTTNESPYRKQQKSLSIKEQKMEIKSLCKESVTQ